MAILGDNKNFFSFEIYPSKIEYCQLYYAFYYHWQGQSIFNNDVITHSDYHPKGMLEASADLCRGGVERDEMVDPIVTFIRNVIKNDRSDAWIPLSGEIQLVIYVDKYFPVLPHHFEKSYEDEVRKRKIESSFQKIYTVMFFVGGTNFVNSSSLSNEGIWNNLIVTRESLEKFADDLEKEFIETVKETDVEDTEC